MQVYTIYGNMQTVDKKLSKSGHNCVNNVCSFMKGCTNGFETKNKTLAHNILISGLDGDPSCGWDTFHNTSCPQQFEYKVENHQILSGCHINQSLCVIHTHVGVEDSIVPDIEFFYENTSSVIVYEIDKCQKSKTLLMQLIGCKHVLVSQVVWLLRIIIQ